MTNLVINVPGEYISLGLVMQSALEQASKGKGKERHAEAGEPYENQIICEVARRVGLGYPLGQAVKKIYESQRLIPQLGVQELLGALNYVAAAVIVMQERMEEEGRRFRDGFAHAEGGRCQNGNDQPEFKSGDRVQVYYPSIEEWRDATYVSFCQMSRDCWRHEVEFASGGRRYVPREQIRPTPKAEGCEELVQKDAPQTPEETCQRIVDSNPATYGQPRTPTGEELAEMAGEARIMWETRYEDNGHA